MFSLQPSGELVYGIPTTSHEADQIRDDVIIANHGFMESNFISFSSSTNNRQLGQATNFGFRNRQTETRDQCNIRRVMHRDIERKRRQEMSNLYVSLRSLLPIERIKGRRPSLCDQMQEAVNHIIKMQKNIRELRIHRDKLKKLSGKKFESSSGCDKLPNCVAVNLVPDGVEILISRTINSSEFGLSRILAELPEKELDVVSCVSTRAKGRSLHKIHTAVRDMTSVDVSVLRDRLTNAIK